MKNKIEVIRYNVDTHSSLGVLKINDKFECYILENVKYMIMEGTYDLGLRKEGTMHRDFLNKYAYMHKGMIEIKNVNWPDGKKRHFLQLHPGNQIADSEGCPLMGDNVNNNYISKGFIGNSKTAYKRMYPKIAKMIEEGEVEITFKKI